MGSFLVEDTICAISTALGVGGISIIRVSGEDSIKIVDTIFSGDLVNAKSHTIHYGHIIYKDKVIDEVLVSVMRAPKTYTTEDIVEINLHGGIATTNKVLEILLNSGCRSAEPGEFTKRAFLNGRIDLVEAEAVGDVINAESENARNMSVNQLTGKLSSIIRALKNDILELEANIEVNIDYPEYEDLEDMTGSKLLVSLKVLKEKLDELIRESKTGKMIKTGLNIALIGRPNVGKSSILNAMLEEDKAIVTDIEGTTRDIVEGRLMLEGICVNFIDTAGIRETENVVEKIGVNKSMSQIDEADIVILVLANDEKVTDEEMELLKKIENKNHIVFVNKDDKDTKIKLDVEGVVYGNTMTPSGLDCLKKKIVSFFDTEKLGNRDFTYISNARQLSLIEKVRESIDSAISNIEDGVPVDLIEIDLANARTHLGEILGEVYDEELIDELFSRFCLGK